jgi:hypothetical protein
MSEPTQLPEWVATVVGRLVLENEMLRRAVAEVAPTPRADEVKP